MLIKKATLSNVKFEILICSLVVLLTVLVYSRVTTYDFINFDDNIYVYENINVISGFAVENIKWAFSFSSDSTYWHPVTWLSHMFDCHFFGLNAGAHHLSSVIIHIINALLLFISLKYMTGSTWRSGVVAVFFALHPLNVDSVAWISERKNLLSTFFWILTMLSYAFYSRKPNVSSYMLMLFLFMLGLLSKPMLITLPFVLLLMDYWPLKRANFFINSNTGVCASHIATVSFSRLVYEKIPLLLMSGVSIWLSMVSLHNINAVISSEKVPVVLRISNALVSYVSYLAKMFWPQNLAVYYPFPAKVALWQAGGAFILLAAVSALAIWCFRSRPYFIVGWLWYLGTLVPVSGIVQGGLWPAMADRWTYVPQIGIFICVAWSGADLIGESRRGRTCFAIILTVCCLIFSAVSWKQAGYWSDSTSLFKHALEVTSENCVAHNNLGESLINDGKIEEASKHFSEAVAIRPDYLLARVNLGASLVQMGKVEEGISHFYLVLKIDPAFASSHYNLGIAYGKQGNIEKSIEHYLAALALDPDSVKSHINIAFAYEIKGDIANAFYHYNEALRIDPSSEDAKYNLGVLYEKRGNANLAVQNYREALRLKPDFKEAHVNIGAVLLGMGEIEEAEDHFTQAVRIDPGFDKAHNSMGAALARQGKIDEAVKQYNEALRINPDYIEAHNNLGVALFNKGYADRAIFHFKKAVQINPDYVNARNNLISAQKYVAAEAVDNRIDEIRTQIAGTPRNPVLYLKLGDLYAGKGDYDNAAGEYLNAVNIKPDFIAALNNLAVVYVVKGESEHALSVFKKVLKLQPDNNLICYNIACLYAKQSNTEASVAWLKKAVDKGYDNWDKIKTDKDLENIRSSTVYNEFIRNI